MECCYCSFSFVANVCIFICHCYIFSFLQNAILFVVTFPWWLESRTWGKVRRLAGVMVCCMMIDHYHDHDGVLDGLLGVMVL